MSCEHYVGNNPNLEAYGLTITGQVRKANEDSCGYMSVPNGELFVVCDGMGGHVGGATASRIAVEQIIEHFMAQKYSDIYQALNDALLRANTQILGEAAANPQLKGMGTTACIVLITGNDAYIAHVGDSRIYLYEAAQRRLFRITKDHSLVQALVDQGQLDDRDAEHHPQKNVITKALGTKEDLKPEVYNSPVQPATGDMFLICSDGLSGMVDDNGIEAILSSGASVEEKTQQLVDNANMPGKGLDNITAQLIKVTYSPYPTSNHPDHNPRWRNGLDSTAQAYSGGPAMFGGKQRKRMKSGLLALIIVGIILLLGGGIGGYMMLRKHSPTLPLPFSDILSPTDVEQRLQELHKSDSLLGVKIDSLRGKLTSQESAYNRNKNIQYLKTELDKTKGFLEKAEQEKINVENEIKKIESSSKPEPQNLDSMKAQNEREQADEEKNKQELGTEAPGTDQ